jgi:hypothetical protein
MSFEAWLTGKAVRKGPFRVIQPWGPNLTRHSTVLTEHLSLPGALDEVDRRRAALIEAGAQAEAINFLVLDGEGKVVD